MASWENLFLAVLTAFIGAILVYIGSKIFIPFASMIESTLGSMVAWFGFIVFCGVCLIYSPLKALTADVG